MTRFSKFYASSIGKKFIAAVTGLVLFGFLAGHVAGNLKAYTGSDQIMVEGAEEAVNVPHIDQYGHFLRVVGEPLVPKLFVLWGARMVLLVSVVLHITVVVQLSMKSAEARPVDYVKSKKAAASWAARYMMVSGLVEGLSQPAVFVSKSHCRSWLYHRDGDASLPYVPWRVESVSNAGLGQSRPQQISSNFCDYRISGNCGWICFGAAGVFDRHASRSWRVP